MAFSSGANQRLDPGPGGLLSTFSLTQLRIRNASSCPLRDFPGRANKRPQRVESGHPFAEGLQSRPSPVVAPGWRRVFRSLGAYPDHELRP
jgi:hypothetical protein